MNSLEDALPLSLRTSMSVQQQKALKHALVVVLSSLGIDMCSLLKSDEVIEVLHSV